MKKIRRVAIITSIHADFDSRIWKYANSLAEAGYKVNLICPWIIPKDLIIHGITIYPFHRCTQRLLRPIEIPVRILRRLLPIFRTIDIIHFHDIDLLPWMAIISLWKPIVYDVHENYPEEMLEKEWIPKPLRPLCYYGVRWSQSFFSRIIRNIILVAPSQMTQFQHSILRILQIRNYASRSLMGKIASDYFHRLDMVIFIGTAYESNGTLLILDIAARVKSDLPTVKFLLFDRFASIESRDRFLHLRCKKGVEDTVIVLPSTPASEMAAILNQATIGIAPNARILKQEMLIPTKLFEYMAAGLPVVSSDLPFQRELFAKYEIGILAKPEEPESFANAIRTLVKNRNLAFSLGKNGQRAFLEEYYWEKQIPSLLEYYDSILEKGKTQSLANIA